MFQRCDVNRLLGIFIIVSSLVSGGVYASTLLQVKNGQTVVRLSDMLPDAFDDCDLVRIKPAVIRGNGTLAFRVVGGALDPNDMVGEVDHSGGVRFECGPMEDESSVSIENLTLDLLNGDPGSGEGEPENLEGDPESGDPAITAIVTANGTVVGRVPFFIPGGDQLRVETSKGGWVKILNADLVLHPTAIKILNDALELSLPDDEPIKVARTWSRINLWKHKYDDDDDDVDEEEKGKKEKKEKEEEEDEEDED